MEILVVMTIAVLIASFGLVISMDSYRGNNFRAEQDLILSTLFKARAQAMANINQQPHGVYLDSGANQYTLYQGHNYPGRDLSTQIIIAGNPDYVLGGTPDITFTQLTGATTVANISLDNNIHSIFYVCINSEGQINVKDTCP